MCDTCVDVDGCVCDTCVDVDVCDTCVDVDGRACNACVWYMLVCVYVYGMCGVCVCVCVYVCVCVWIISSVRTILAGSLPQEYVHSQGAQHQHYSSLAEL